MRRGCIRKSDLILKYSKEYIIDCEFYRGCRIILHSFVSHCEWPWLPFAWWLDFNDFKKLQIISADSCKWEWRRMLAGMGLRRYRYHNSKKLIDIIIAPIPVKQLQQTHLNNLINEYKWDMYQYSFSIYESFPTKQRIYSWKPSTLSGPPQWDPQTLKHHSCHFTGIPVTGSTCSNMPVHFLG